MSDMVRYGEGLYGNDLSDVEPLSDEEAREYMAWFDNEVETLKRLPPNHPRNRNAKAFPKGERDRRYLRWLHLHPDVWEQRAYGSAELDFGSSFKPRWR